MIKTLLLTSFFFITSFIGFSASRYWTATTPSNWNDVANWSTFSGGPGGASVPVAGDYVYFDGAGYGNCDLDIDALFDGLNTNGYTGVIDLKGFVFDPSTGGNGIAYFSGGTMNNSGGLNPLLFTSTNLISFLGMTFNLSIDISGGRIAFSGGVFNEPVIIEDTGGSSANGNGGCVFNSTLHVTNSGTSYFLMGLSNPDVFNDDVTFINTSTSRMRMAYGSTGTQFNGDIHLGCTNGAGIWFGESTGTSFLANTKKIQIDPIGFSDGDLRLKNFTQLGTTSQSFSLTGTSGLVYDTGTIFNADVDTDAPRFFLTNATFNGKADLEKTGANSDASNGGNVFAQNVIIRNSGSGYWLSGNASADVFMANLILENTSSSNIYLAHNSIGNTIVGDLTINNAGHTTSSNVYICAGVASDLTVDGSVILNNICSATNGDLQFGMEGDVSVGGSLTVNNNTTGTNGNVRIAVGSGSDVVIQGNTVLNNLGSLSSSYIVLGNGGNTTFNGTVSVLNSSPAGGSSVYLNRYSSSTGVFNEDIILEVTTALNDGILFGVNGGNMTLAANKTIQIGPAGYISGDLYLRNFTQIGTTNQTLLLTGSTTMNIYDSDWGGSIDFRSPALYSRGSHYRQSAILEKTGGVSSNLSYGGNVFDDDLDLINSGSGYLGMGQYEPDSCLANLNLLNTGENYIYFAYGSIGNYVAGDLQATNSGFGNTSGMRILNNSTNTLVIDGDCDFVNAPTSTNSAIVLGNDGVFRVNGNLTALNAGDGNSNTLYLGNSGTFEVFGNLTATNGGGNALTNTMYISNGTACNVTVHGTFEINNVGSGTTRRVYLGNQGTVNCLSNLDIKNSSSANNSQVYCNYNSSSIGNYADDIVVENTDALGDGVFFGYGGGVGTLAATKTINFGVGGFVAGELQLRNFTQVGPTNQTLLGTGTARIYMYDSDFGGNIDFRAPDVYTRGSHYAQTTFMKKTGGSVNNMSYGDNVFEDDLEIVNAGDGYLGMGQIMPDSCLGNFTVRNTGSNSTFFAYGSIGNYVAGDFLGINTGTGNNTAIRILNSTTNTLVINGNCDLVNNPSSASSSLVLGANGFLTINGDLSVSNTGTGNSHSAYVCSSGSVEVFGDVLGSNGGTATTNNFYIAYGNGSNVEIHGSTSLNNIGSSTTSRMYLGNQGDIVCHGVVNLLNASSANNSQFYCNYYSTSIGQFYDDIIVESSNSLGDGLFFGTGGGASFLASGKTIRIGAGGFVSGDLYFRNFTQLGSTAQTLLTTGSTTLSNYNSNWGGDVDFTAPGIYTRESIYQGKAKLTKTGPSSNYSLGGNVFEDDATITHSGSSGYLIMSASPIGLINEFKGNVTYIKNGAGGLFPSYNNPDTYAKDINLDANTSIFFGSSGNGRVVLNGSTDQNINDLGSPSMPSFRDLQVNKTAGVVNVNTSIEIVVELDLDQGIVNTTSSNLIFMRDNSIVSSVSDLSHIDGPIEKVGNDAFVFPVGDSSFYRPIAISAPSSTAARFNAEYFYDNPSPTYDENLKEITLDHIGNCEYWILDRVGTASNVNVTLSWDQVLSCGVDVLSELVVARWDGTEWKNHGNSSTTGTPLSGTVTTSSPVTSFSPFTLGSTTANNPLPVELLSFTAKEKGSFVELAWSTASEINNDYFLLEKSSNGKEWGAVSKVDGAGNSYDVLTYLELDRDPELGLSYYRLKQVDFDGKFTYSAIESVMFDGTEGNLAVYPNPTDGLIRIVGISSSFNEFEMYNSLGQKVSQKVLLTEDGKQLDLSQLASGVYVLKMNGKSSRIVKL